MIARVYRIRPWEMGRLTVSEWNQIADEVKRMERQARKEARSR